MSSFLRPGAVKNRVTCAALEACAHEHTVPSSSSLWSIPVEAQRSDARAVNGDKTMSGGPIARVRIRWRHAARKGSCDGRARGSRSMVVTVVVVRFVVVLAFPCCIGQTCCCHSCGYSALVEAQRSDARAVSGGASMAESRLSVFVVVVAQSWAVVRVVPSGV